ncbi:MAG TPA: CRTAC1 family protein [Candidatus Acidoferrales bacterium]|nr:CRTAC1 family protein [Candidatus Acidoferrales bacterium]
MKFHAVRELHTRWLRLAIPVVAPVAVMSLAPAFAGRSRAELSAAESPAIQFEDITRAAGIHFTHDNGAYGRKFLPEAMGSGVAFIDYDNDGWQDIFFVNSADWPDHRTHAAHPALYHNNHDGTFTDVTVKAGLDVEMYGMGVAVGDYNNDGCDDLFITALGQNRLFRNNCNGTFTDVTKQAGLWGPNEFSTSAAWVDYDRDGKLDLVVANYVQWSEKTDIYCTIDGKSKSYCTPESYQGASVRLWHNRGDGTFEDVTQKAGLGDATSKTLGVTILDANQDGWPDIAFSNDTQPNKLYINNGNGTFSEKGVAAGVGFSEDGIARAGMGIDAGDYDHSGYPSLLITNFSNQMAALYHNERNGLFVDEAAPSGVGRASLLTLGFGCFFFDYDLDGWPDIFIANGHIEDGIEKIQNRVRYAEPPHLFRNLANGKFEETTAQMGARFAAARVARGAAYGDIDNDGAPDIAISTNGGAALLFHNTGATNHRLRIKLVGTSSNRDGIGATVRLAAGADTQTQMLRSGSSYLSSNELVLTFGLGAHAKADTIEVRWPSGKTDRLTDVNADQILTIKEGAGQSAAQPLRRK